MLARARPPPVLLTELIDEANALFFFSPPSFFAAITVVLHGWRYTSTSSILTAASFWFKDNKAEFHYFNPNLDDFAAVRSSFLTGPIEIQSLSLALQYQNQRW